MQAHSSRRFVVLALALAFGAAGCASGGGGGSSRPEGATSSRIVRAEFEPLGQINAYLAIERLRPQWLRTRSGDQPVLYVDGGRRGSFNDLRTTLVSEIEQIEWMSANDATTRYGTGHTGGAIFVTTIR